jgi:hypothetical protein
MLRAMPPERESTGRPESPRWPLALAVPLILIGCWLLATPGGKPKPPPVPRAGHPAALLAPVSHSLPAAVKPPKAKPIEEIRLGDRVTAGNPEAGEGPAEPEVDPATWRRVDLLLPRGPGNPSDVDIALLRPRDWLERTGAAVGGIVDLAMPELGVVGPARVLSIGPCVPIAPGRGRIVTGTFSHDSDAIIDLRVEDQAGSIGVTASHLVYSQDRGTFVAAGDLRDGESLRPVAGTAKVASLARRPGVHRVYNLEVAAEHAYRVASAGILVHNDCPLPDPSRQLPAPKSFKNQYPNDAIETPRQVYQPWQVKNFEGRTLNYVVTEGDNLIIGRIAKQPGGGHIDLAGGAPVKAAGEVVIRNGEIKYLDNASGHYLPTGRAAQEAAERAFTEAGFDPKGKYIAKFFDPQKGWIPVGGL